jgi:hypothetical protein
LVFGDCLLSLNLGLIVDMIQLLWLLTAMIMCDGVNGQTWLQRYGDIDGEAKDDGSGAAVAISGDGKTLAVGAPENDANGDGSGHVRVFRDDGTGWVQLGDDIDGEAVTDESVIG